MPIPPGKPSHSRYAAWPHALASLFFPHLCAGCGSHLLKHTQSICHRCLSRLPYTNFSGQVDNPVEKVFLGRIGVEAASSLCYFTRSSIVQNILHELKYAGNTECGIEMGRSLGKALQSSGRFTGVDFVVPVPLSAAKKRRRGYNQSEMVALGVSSILPAETRTDIVVKVRNTATQTHKTRTERWENVREVFQVGRGTDLTGKGVLLVDDVVTTGASLEACGRALLEAGCPRLFIASLAYTER